MRHHGFFALLLAGSFFCCGCTGGGTVKKGVTVNGVEVGGLPLFEAAARVRETLAYLPLTVKTPAGDFSAPISYSDDVEEILKKARRGEKYEASVRREWVELEEDLEAICSKNAREAEDAALSFSADGFCYTPEKRGVACDYSALCKSATRALRTGEREISLTPIPTEAKVREEDLRARTRPLSSFTTSYDEGNAPRAHNIALAAARLSGSEIGAGEEFSFNGTVGRRTRENGFEEAAVIYDGEFVQGVGGGVCQASTTLFGAALRAGLKITESRPHSLTIGYVGPSQDAMVSETSDLRFVNPYDEPVYLLASAEGGKVTFSFYGLPRGVRYEVESNICERLPPPKTQVVEGTCDRTVRAAREGLKSECVLISYDENGREIARTVIRKDTYSPVQGIEERAKKSPADILAEEEN